MSYLAPPATQSLLATSKAWRAQSYAVRELVFRPPVGLHNGQVCDAAFERRLSQSSVSNLLVRCQLGQVTTDAVARALGSAPGVDVVLWRCDCIDPTALRFALGDDCVVTEQPYLESTCDQCQKVVSQPRHGVCAFCPEAMCSECAAHGWECSICAKPCCGACGWNRSLAFEAQVVCGALEGEGRCVGVFC